MFSEDAKDKAEKEAQEKKEREEAEHIEKLRQEALRPDREKIIAFADTIASIQRPELSTEAGNLIMMQPLMLKFTMNDATKILATAIKQKANEL